MQQVAFGLVVEEDLQNAIEDALLDHELDRHGVLGLDDRFEKLDDLNVGLDRFVLVAFDDFEQDRVRHEKHAELV